MIEFDCLQCGTHLRIADEFAGKTGRCRQCGNHILAPASARAYPTGEGSDHDGAAVAPDDTLKRHLVAFDVETTGLSPFSDRIVEFGAVKFDPSGEIVATFEELVNPGQPIPPEVTAIHGITDAAVRDCPSLESVSPLFRAFLGPFTNLLFAHNAIFDTRFLAHELVRQGLPLTDFAIFDTIDVARRLVHERSYKLGLVAEALGIRQTGAHRALADALTVKEIVVAFIQRSSPENAFSFLETALPSFSLGGVGVEPVDLKDEFEEIWAAMQASREATFTYWGGTNPGQTRCVVPKAAFAYKQKRYLSALCTNNTLRTFRLDQIGDTCPDRSRVDTLDRGVKTAPQAKHKLSETMEEGKARMNWSIDVTSGTSRFKQIQDIIRGAIESGELLPGDQLPTVREIAESCDVNTNTVSQALRELQLRGIIYSRRGSGMFVADQSKAAGAGELIDDVEPEEAEMPEQSSPSDDIQHVPAEASYDVLGMTLARIFSHLDKARKETEAAGLDWKTTVNLFNTSAATSREQE